MKHPKPSGPTRSVHVRLSPTLGSALDIASSSADLSAAGWARQVIARALPGHETSTPKLPRSPRRRPVIIPPEDLVAAGRLAGTVGRCTGATIQLARALREAALPAHAEAEIVLADLRAVQRDLVSLVGILRRNLGPDQ